MRGHVGVLLSGRGVGRLAICFLVVVAAAAGVMVVPAASRAALLAPTPYMGWNTYYGVGGHFDEATIKSVAASLISSGLAQAGYRIVWLDFGWASGARDATGQLIVDPTQWPDGMAGLAAWLHQQGLQAGIYTDAGRTGCDGQGVGSYGHYQQDADTFAAWGFDAVKVDFCGAGQEGFAPQPLYEEFSQALSHNSSHRPMILNVDNFWVPGQIDGTNPSLANSSYDNYQWSPQIAHSWRTDTDIGFIRSILFSNVLRNLDQDARHPEAAGPGHWNDPDYLGPGLGMTDAQTQSQFSMWAMLAAPLILGSDPRALSPAQISMLENSSVIAVDQDPLGAQATLISQSGSGQVWAKPLANGDVAVGLFNRGTSSSTISTNAGAVGLPQAGSYTIQDLWANTPWANPPSSTTAGPITALVPPQTVALYRVTAGTQTDNTAALRVAMGSADSGAVSATPGPISCPGTCSARYPAGSPVTLTATPTGGAVFVGWNGGGCSGSGTCSPTPTISSTTSITASFAFPLHTLTVNLNGAGSVTDASGVISCPGTCSVQYWPGTNVALTATPSPGMVFAGWSGPCSGTGTCTVPLGDDVAVTARFAPVHKLTVSLIGAGAGTITGSGISCPGACSASYPAGTSVTLAATPAAGSRFGAWLGSGCASARSGCTVTLSHDVTVDAAFDLPRSGTAYVVDARRNTVTPVDLAVGTTKRGITGFDHPRAIATAPDGGTAYVVDAGDGAVTPINLATNRTEPAITGFVHPGPIAVTPDGRTAYVLEDGPRLVPVDLVTDQSEPPIAFAKGSGVGRYARSLAIAPDGKTAYLGTFTPGTPAVGGTVAAVDLATGRVRAVFRGFADPTAIAVTPTGNLAYVADVTRGDVTPINLATTRRIAAPALTARGAFPGADDLAITPDGTTVYVATNHLLAGTASHEYAVGVIRTATNTALTAGLTGIASPAGLAITPDGRTAYIAGQGSMVPLDVATDTERPAVNGLGSPTAIAITVPPPANYSAKLAAKPRVRGNGVIDAVTCSSSTTSCTTIQTLTVTETVSPKSVAVTARAERHRSRRVVLVIGSRTLTIRPHRTVEVTIRLNAVGRQLTKRFGKLPVVLSLAIRRGGHKDTLTTGTLTIGASTRPQRN